VVVGTDWSTFAAALSGGAVGLAGIVATAVITTQERRHRDSERLYASCIALLSNVDHTLVTGREVLIWDHLRPTAQEQVLSQARELNRDAAAAISSLRPQLPNGSLIDRAARRLIDARNAYTAKVTPGVDHPTLYPFEVVLLNERETFIAELQRIVPPPRNWRRKSRSSQSDPVVAA
jgi:hypothetical protein